jgi:branched-chain amino acid transport system permease protein
MQMIGGMVGYTLVATLGLPFAPSILLAMAAAAVVSAVAERLAYRPLRLRGSSAMNLFIATIGMSIFLRNAAIPVWTSEPLRYPPVFGTRPIVLGAVIVPAYVPWVLLTGLVFVVALTLFFRYTRTGVAMRAAAQDPTTARLMGIAVDRMILYTFALSAALGGAAGVLLGPVFYASFNMGLDVGIKGFAAATLGGLGSMPGAMVGGLLLGVLEALGASWISSDYKDAIAYGILIGVLLFRPSGILGRGSVS